MTNYICSEVNPSDVQTLHLSNKRHIYGQIEHFFSLCPLDLFSSRLRSLSPKSCSENELRAILEHLHLLAKLTVFSFVANASTLFSSDARNQLVRTLSQLLSLRQCTIKVYDDGLVFNHRTKYVFGSLEYCYIHLSSLDRIVHLCSHAHNLKRLLIGTVYDEALSIEDCSSLSNLTHFSMRTAASMNEHDRMLTKAKSLVSLSLVCSGVECCDGLRWQQL